MNCIPWQRVVRLLLSTALSKQDGMEASGRSSTTKLLLAKDKPRYQKQNDSPASWAQHQNVRVPGGERKRLTIMKVHNQTSHTCAHWWLHLLKITLMPINLMCLSWHKGPLTPYANGTTPKFTRTLSPLLWNPTTGTKLDSYTGTNPSPSSSPFRVYLAIG